MRYAWIFSASPMPRPLGRDHLDRQLELAAAVAPARSEYVARHALGVHPDEYVGAVANIAQDEREVLVPIDDVAVGDRRELALVEGETGGVHPLDQPLVLPSVRDQVADSGHDEAMLLSELEQRRKPRHLAVGCRDLADHRDRAEAREHREIDRGLCVPGAPEHAAGLVGEWEDVPRLREVGRPGSRVDQGLDGVRPSCSGRDDPRRRGTPSRAGPCRARPSAGCRAPRDARGTSARR
jgi:hypothetical protein